MRSRGCRCGEERGRAGPAAVREGPVAAASALAPQQGAFECPGETKPSWGLAFLAHVRAGECGEQTVPSTPQSYLCPPFSGTGTLWVLECKLGPSLCRTSFPCGFAKGVCTSHLFLWAARRRTEQSRPYPACFLTIP